MKKLCLLLGLIYYKLTIAQFGTNPPFFTYGFTTPATESAIGIGTFTSVPSSRLHVNNFLLGSPNGTLNGFLFRTDGSNTVVNQWQMYTGTTAGTATEKFKLTQANNINSSNSINS